MVNKLSRNQFFILDGGSWGKVGLTFICISAVFFLLLVMANIFLIEKKQEKIKLTKKCLNKLHLNVKEKLHSKNPIV
jgi:Tfp pilus assembly protein PilO